MIGCQEEADEIARWDVNTDRIGPKGWQYLGEGVSRKAYLSPSGVVYKLQIYNDVAHNGVKIDRDNEMEWDGYQRCESYPLSGWRPALTTLYYSNDIPVIAMEYIEGDNAGYCERLVSRHSKCDCYQPHGKCLREHRDNVHAAWGLIDADRDNVIVDSDGTMVLIDMVC